MFAHPEPDDNDVTRSIFLQKIVEQPAYVIEVRGKSAVIVDKVEKGVRKATFPGAAFVELP